jgi:hypothetical protein
MAQRTSDLNGFFFDLLELDAGKSRTFVHLEDRCSTFF